MLLVFQYGYSQISGKAIGITDGDTFALLTTDKKTIKARLHGIDTPEAKQDFGQRAKLFLSEEIFNKVVYLKGTKYDKYGRLLGVIYINEHYSDLSTNKNLLQADLAWHYKI